MTEPKFPYSLTELEDVKADCNIGESTNDFDDRIRAIISGVSQAIEDMTGIEFAAREKKNELRDGSGTCRMILPAPLIAVTALTNDTTTIDTTDIDEFVFEPDTGIIELTNGTVFVRGRSKITISYRHGYEEIPYNVKRAATIWAAHQFIAAKEKRFGVTSQTKKEESASFTSDRIPPEALGLIEGFIVGSF